MVRARGPTAVLPLEYHRAGEAWALHVYTPGTYNQQLTANNWSPTTDHRLDGRPTRVVWYNVLAFFVDMQKIGMHRAIILMGLIFALTYMKNVS